VEPTVYADDDVAIRVSLEVSTIAREIQTATGTLAYQIGTRNASTMLRLRDGETQLLAGLISREDRTSSSRVPGLGDLPVMGRLFSSQTDDSQRTELVLAITPRIIRNVRALDAGESEVWVGTETQPRLRPYGGRLPGVAAAAQPERIGTTPAAGSAPAPTNARPAAAAPAAPTLKTQWRGPQHVAVGDTFVVTLDVDTTAPLRGGPVQLAYSKDRLTLVDVQQGELLRQGGAATAFTQTVAAAEGTARAAVLRSEASGVTGNGSLLQLRFKATAAGDAELRLAGFEAVTLGEGAATQQGAPPLRIQVKP
jgi:general secretion pathway protein D